MGSVLPLTCHLPFSIKKWLEMASNDVDGGGLQPLLTPCNIADGRHVDAQPEVPGCLLLPRKQIHTDDLVNKC